VGAALADLEIGVGRAGGEPARGVGPGDGGQRLGGHVGPALKLVGGQPQVDLGQLASEVLAVAADEASGHGHDGPSARARLRFARVAHGVEDGVDGFLHRGLDEPAGVDQGQVGVRHLVHRDHGRAQRAQKPLGIHAVFGTAQADGEDVDGIG
jgi:hypothetical protein